MLVRDSPGKTRGESCAVVSTVNGKRALHLLRIDISFFSRSAFAACCEGGILNTSSEVCGVGDSMASAKCRSEMSKSQLLFSTMARRIQTTASKQYCASTNKVHDYIIILFFCENICSDIDMWK